MEYDTYHFVKNEFQVTVRHTHFLLHALQCSSVSITEIFLNYRIYFFNRTQNFFIDRISVSPALFFNIRLCCFNCFKS